MIKIIKELSLAGLFIVFIISCQSQPVNIAGNCRPTPPDEMGPFYRPNAPVRSIVGEGYLLKGTIKSASECRPLPGAILEFWLVNENGEYDEAHRGQVIADKKGRYSFESNPPTDYFGRLPHIHIRVSAKGHETLITQHYSQAEKSTSHFDLILSQENI